MAFRRENHRDDNDRTCRLLDAWDAAEGRYGDPAFDNVIGDGLASDKAEAAAGNYPPRGHGYPKKG